MDLFSMDKKLANFKDQDFGQFLDDDLFTPSPSNDSSSMDFSLESGMDQDWLDTFFDDPVLNDRMISDALQPHPQVQSEHSYSLANEKALDMTIKKEQEKDSDTELLGTTVNPNNMTLTIKTEDLASDYRASTSKCNYILASPASSIASTSSSDSMMSPRNLHTTTTHTNAAAITNNSATTFIKKEPGASDMETTMVTVTRTINPQTLLKPTIILATQPAMQTTTTSHSSTHSHHQERLVLPKVNVTVGSSNAATYSICNSSEASSPEHISYEQLSLPPTPPSSNSSDSEGCQSPERSLPPSPIRGGHHHTIISHSSQHHSPRPLSPCSSGLASPFFMNPIPTSGVLLLSEEEKRTLISEGYPIPAKLPLTKGEEKNLKKIRRKIKNKISAQESRRKKKEYLESLERKVESYSQDNVDLKKKVDSLENNNRSLMSQLHKLQNIVGKLRPHSTSQTSTCLMVLVLCFAVFLGTWSSPMSWNIGYSSINATPTGHLAGPSDHHHFGAAPPSYQQLEPLMEDDSGGLNRAGQRHGFTPADLDYSSSQRVMGPEVKEASTDPYTTGNLKSRVLLSVKEEEEQLSHHTPPFCLKDYISQWFQTTETNQPGHDTEEEEEQIHCEPPLPKVDVLDVEMENNQTGEGCSQGAAAASDARRLEEQASMHPDITVMTQTRNQLDTAA